MKHPQSMVKCRIIAPKIKQSLVINTLFELNIFHVTSHKKGEQNLDIGEPFATTEELSILLHKARSILSHYPQVLAKKVPLLGTKNYSSLKKIIEKNHDDFLAITEQLTKRKEELEKINEQVSQVEEIQKFAINTKALQNSNTLSYQFGRLENATKHLPSLKNQFPNGSVLHKEDLVLLVVPKADEQKLISLLKSHPFTSQPLVAYEKKEYLNLKKNKEILLSKITLLSKKKKNLETQLSLLKGFEEQLSIEVCKQELPLQFAITEKTFVAQGWIPQNDALKIKETLEKTTQGIVHVDISNPTDHDEPPIKLANRKLVTPFEFFLRLYNLPKYHEIDPTSIMFITFPLFFGFMLGDVGYGLVLTLLFFFLKRKIPQGKELFSILLFASIVSMGFGFVFGEFFGFEYLSYETGKSLCDSTNICFHKTLFEHHGEKTIIYEFPHLLSRTHAQTSVLGYNLLSVLVVGAIVGFIHLNLGFLLGFFNEFHHHGFFHALAAKGSWIIIEVGIILAILSSLNMLIPLMLWVGLAVAFLGLILLGVGEGVQGLVELPALISNTLSYMRLGAVGLASVGLAIVVNENLGLPLIEKGGIFILLGIIVMILGHGINLALGVIGPFLHAVRLHYVEFFSKFFHGGGIEYNPFGKDTVNKKSEA